MQNISNETGGTLHQLESIYAEREQLASQIGVCDADGILNMVRSLEAQLCDLYQRFGGIADADGSTAAALLVQVNQLAEHLDAQFSEKSISLEIVDDKPVMRAEWKEHLNQGAHE
ncbi:MAG: hypothetical protein AAGI30_00900 [Planctomycetota bacterium]